MSQGGAAEEAGIAAATWHQRLHGPEAAKHRAAFEEWLAADPANRAAWEKLERGDALLSALLPHTKAAARRTPPVSKPATRRAPAMRYALAASLALALLAGAALLLSSSPPPAGRPVIATLRLASPVGIRSFALADGTRLTLDTATNLEIVDSAGSRELLLRSGRVRVDARDSHSRWRLRVADAIFEAEGLYELSKAPGACLSVIDGVANEVQAPRAARRLVSAQALPAPSAAAPVALDRTRLQWTSGMLSFDRVTLAELAAEANRYSVRKLILGDTDVRQYHATGAFRVGDPDKLAASLAAAFGLVVHQREDGAVVLTRQRKARQR